MLRRPKNPGSRAHVERTPAQWKAFRIFQLRGLYWSLGALTGPRLTFARQLVDWELTRLGAETESDRYARQRAEAEARWAAEDAAAPSTQPAEVDQDLEEIPF